MDKDVCCPEFNPKQWDNKTLNWKNKNFVMATTPTIFHIPISPLMNKAITMMCAQVEESNAGLPPEDSLMLFYDPSMFKSEIYLSTTKEIPGANNVTLSGTFMTKVFEGPYKSVPQWLATMDALLAKQGKKSKKYYVHYAYCPKCAEKYGHNYGIVFAQV